MTRTLYTSPVECCFFLFSFFFHARRSFSLHPIGVHFYNWVATPLSDFSPGVFHLVLVSINSGTQRVPSHVPTLRVFVRVFIRLPPYPPWQKTTDYLPFPAQYLNPLTFIPYSLPLGNSLTGFCRREVGLYPVALALMSYLKVRSLFPLPQLFLLCTAYLPAV